MTDVQPNLSDASLARAVIGNLHDIFRHLRKSRSADFESNDGIVRWHTPMPHPWFNGVLSERTARPGDSELVLDAAAYFAPRGWEQFSWWIDPSVAGAGWEDLLAKHGFTYDDPRPGMAIDLTKLETPRVSADNFAVSVVEDADALAVWSRTTCEGFGMDTAAADGLLRTMDGIGLELPVRNYIGYLDSEPVATSTLFVANGAAGVYNVATLEAARGKGIGAAITAKALVDGRDLGYRVGILQSSEMGYSVYKRMGFEEVCKVGNFWGPARPA